MGRNSLAHQNEDLRLTDLVGPDRPELIDVVFKRCTIHGPAVVQLVDSQLSDNDYGIGVDRLEAALWTVSPWMETVRGAIVARHCIFVECTFEGIAFAGGAELAETLRVSGSGVSVAS